MLDDPTFQTHNERQSTASNTRRIAVVELNQSPEQVKATELHPLTPKYQPEKHAVYFRAIKDALAWTGDDTVRNIALTGSYGVGKSSILRQVAMDPDLKVIQVSLSTLGFGPDSAEKSVKPRVGDGDKTPQPNPLRETKTNQIQKEIVKQLLYTQMPEKMPGSRYRRTSAFRPKREALFALATGVPIALIFFLLGWTAQLAQLFTVPADWAIAANTGLVLVAALFVYGVRSVTHNKIRIDSVSTGAATIKLSAASDTYFDEYLDEIVYFFEVVDADIVIFEDIDRFEDAHIFETLRELNTILNGAKQLNGRVIRFLYAIKDSIFEELGTRAAREAAVGPDAPVGQNGDAAMLEVARANRTKFFDLVVPVVPFVTHQSARELMASELASVSKHDVSDDLIDLVAQHVPDMRLIKNIRNEFVIFREQVIKGSSLSLTDDALFAMVLYKSTHLSDFEQIKLGKSALDTLYRDSRTIVTKETARLNLEIQNVRRLQRTGAAIKARSARLGETLENYIATMLGHFKATRVSLQYGTESLDADLIRSTAFWKKYASNPIDITLNFRDPWRGGDATVLTPAHVEKAVGEPIDPDDWETTTEAEATKRIEAARADIQFLRRAEMSDLMQRTDFTLDQPGGKRASLYSRAERLLGSPLAIALVEQGYIDRYFTLYTSTFVGERINANAMNFILKNVDTGTMDIYAPLTSDEVKAVLRERPRLALREKSAYNLDFVDHLLTYEPDAAKVVLGNLERHGEHEAQFLQAYLASERDLSVLVGSLAASWPQVLAFLTDEVEIDDERRLRAVDAALNALSGDVEYVVTEGVGSYLLEHHEALLSFTDPKRAAAASEVAAVVDAAELSMPKLAALSDPVRAAVVAVEQFDVTRDNLLTAIAPSTELALDALQQSAIHVFNRVLSDLGSYLAALEDDEYTISEPNSLVQIIEIVTEADKGAVDQVVGRSPSSYVVKNLDDADNAVWPSLAAHKRFAPKFADVYAYIEHYGLDANVAVVLADGAIEAPDGAGEDAKREVAQQILFSSAVMPSPELRANLLGSLGLAEPILPEEVPVEPGELIGRLIERNVILDDADSFALIQRGDWGGLEYAIGVSEEIAGFISPAILPTDMIIRFLDSARIPDALKTTVVRRFEEFAEDGGRDVVLRMASYALDNDISVEWGAVKLAANQRVGSSVVLRLLRRFTQGVTLAHLRPILTDLGGDYPLLLEANGRHPRFPATPEVQALLERLQQLGTVNTIVATSSGLKANMKRG